MLVFLKICTHHYPITHVYYYPRWTLCFMIRSLPYQRIPLLSSYLMDSLVKTFLVEEAIQNCQIPINTIHTLSSTLQNGNQLRFGQYSIVKESMSVLTSLFYDPTQVVRICYSPYHRHHLIMSISKCRKLHKRLAWHEIKTGLRLVCQFYQVILHPVRHIHLSRTCKCCH